MLGGSVSELEGQTLISLIVLPALALELSALPERPSPVERVANQCPATVALVPGRPIPAGLVDEAGLVICSAVALPTSEALDLVALEAWSDAIEARYRLDVGALRFELAWYASRLEELERPPAWYQTRAAARWGGRLEVLATVAILAGIAVGSERLRE